MIRLLRALILVLVLTAAALPASAQIFDSSGNGLLSGTYLFRQVVYLLADQGDIGRAILVYGSINFDGKGNYQLTSNVADSSLGTGPYNINGLYAISASGFGFLQHPIANSAEIYGTVSNGVFIGSSTDAGFNDLFVAVQTSGATTSGFQGSYTMAYLNYPTGRFEDNYSSLATFTADGGGNIGSVQFKYYVAGNGPNSETQTETGVRVAFSQGVGTLTFPTTAQLLLQGPKMLFVSPDGNFFVGGSPNAFDFFIGVKRGATPPTAFSGLYFLGGINQALNDPSVGGEMDTYYGALQAGRGTLIGHQRFFDLARTNAQNYTYTDFAPADPVAEYVNESTQTEYFFSSDGRYRIGFGRGPYLGLSVAMQAPTFSGSGVYLNPTGVLNGASSAPFTAGIAPGELLTLYGSNLANNDLLVAGTLPLPTTLGGVQVLINNRPAPIYYVSRDQIAAIVPYGTTELVAQVQVVNNGVNSNAVTTFVYASAPGVFSVPPGGAGYAAALHADFTLVTQASPARPGEVLQVYLTGLGKVFPTIQDGAPGPVGQLAVADNIDAYVDLVKADVLFAGLAPTLPALYQVNLKVPDGTRSGDLYLDIAGPGALTSQVLLPVAGAAADARSAAEAPRRRR